MSLSIRLGRLNLRWLSVLIPSLLALLINPPIHAAVVTVGNVTPVPPVGGGSVGGTFRVGNTSFGSVSVAEGTAITSAGTATVGDAATGIGTISLDGFGSDWTLTTSGSDLTLGDEGVGTIKVSNAAVLNVNDDSSLGVDSTGMGWATVTGLGSVWNNGDDITIGSNGQGNIEVLNGGQLFSDRATLGDNTSGDGRVTVTGNLSRWQLGTAAVGSSGFGSVTVTEGGWVVSSAVTLANSATSRAEVLVDGSGSQWNITGAMTTSLGDALVRIANGGRIFTTTPSTISATSRVTMAGGRWDYVGTQGNAISIFGVLEGNGTLDMPGVELDLNGGSRGRLQIGENDHMLLTGLLSNDGVVDLDGGELEVRSTVTNDFRTTARNGAVLRVGSTGLTNSGNAQLSITGGTVDVFGTVNNQSNAEIAVVGGSTGIFHDAVTNSGTIFVSPGSEIVMLEDLDFSSSSALNIALADATNSFGQAVTSGEATLAGTLNVALSSGFAPSLGDSFQIISAGGGLTGTFASEHLPPLSAGLDWLADYGSNALTLQVIAATLPGDFDHDSDVDGRDFLVWQRGDSPNGTGSGDLALWQAAYGNTPPLLASSRAVPEPCSLMLLFSLLMAPVGRKHRLASGR